MRHTYKYLVDFEIYFLMIELNHNNNNNSYKKNNNNKETGIDCEIRYSINIQWFSSIVWRQTKEWTIPFRLKK